jgi:NitT/TauT family transport system substrate-binding protein
VFSVPPFQQRQLEKAGVHTILNSFDIMDGPHTFTVAWTTTRFRNRNPVLYKALIAALKEATGIVDKDRQKAAGYRIKDVNSKLPLDEVTAVVSGAQVR